MLNKQLLMVLVMVSMSISGCATGPRPFDGQADSEGMISTALADMSADKKLLLTFGANWCSDSRKLAAAYEQQPLAALLEQNYNVVFIDVGQRDNNMQLAADYNVPVMGGIPSIALVSKDGEVTFSSKAIDLNNADKMSEEDIYAYFEKLSTDSEVVK